MHMYKCKCVNLYIHRIALKVITFDVNTVCPKPEIEGDLFFTIFTVHTLFSNLSILFHKNVYINI